MSENLKNEHVFSKHCSSVNFHPTGLKFWPMRDFILGQILFSDAWPKNVILMWIFSFS